MLKACPKCASADIDSERSQCRACRATFWIPNPGPQTKFLSCTVDEVLYGGSAGGGKSAAIIALPLRWIHHPGYNGITFRRETPDLADLIRKARPLYEATGAKFNANDLRFRWPSGAVHRFAHLQHEKDVTEHHGQEYAPLVMFDELTHFTQFQYLELYGRLRSAHPDLPKFIRSTTNPGSEGHEWVFKRWGAWLDPTFQQPARTVRVSSFEDPSRPVTVECIELKPRIELVDGKPVAFPPLAGGEPGYLVRDFDSDAEFFVRGRSNLTASRTFIPSMLSDNKALIKADPGYARKLDNLDPVRRAQLKRGDWLARNSPGKMFRREWFRHVQRLPGGWTTSLRYWDRAATEHIEGQATASAEDPDWTVGVRMAVNAKRIINPQTGEKEWERYFFLEDVVAVRGNPGTVKRLILETARLDGKECLVGLEHDPGQAGKFEVAEYVKVLVGFGVKVIAATKAKEVRAAPASAQLEHGRVAIVDSMLPWPRCPIELFFRQLEDFPTKGRHDDCVDAFSGCLNALADIDPVGYEDEWDEYLPSMRI